MIGRTFGSYRITAQIGAGGMGVVYAAEHVVIGRKAAIKVLLPKYTGNPEVVQRFFNEAKAAAKIAHRGIVDVLDSGKAEDGIAYIIMEFLDGETLGERARRLRRLPEEDVVRIARQVAVALGAAHDAGIVHRDLKPDNIFLVPDPEVIGGERVKLLDFGIAKLLGMSEDVSKTKTGVVMGSPLYMSPEQCRGAGEADFRSDIYALGCVMYHIACGRPPFVGTGGGEILAKHIYEQPAPPRRFLPEMSPALESIILRAIAKEPGDRFPDMGRVATALDAASGSRFRSSTEVVPYDASLADAREVTDLSARVVAEQRPVATTLGVAASQVSSLSLSPARRRTRLGLLVGVPLAMMAGVAAAVVVGGGGDDPAVTRGDVAVARDAGAGDRLAPADARPTAVAEVPVDAASPRDAGDVDAPPAPGDAGTSAPPARPTSEQTIRIAIISKPPGAAVRDDDGRVVGRTPLRTRIARDRKRHVYTVHKAGYRDEPVVVIANRDRTFRPRLRRVRAPDREPQDGKPGDRQDGKPGDRQDGKPDDGFGQTVDPFKSKGGSK